MPGHGARSVIDMFAGAGRPGGLPPRFRADAGAGTTLAAAVLHTSAQSTWAFAAGAGRSRVRGESHPHDRSQESDAITLEYGCWAMHRLAQSGFGLASAPRSPAAVCPGARPPSTAWQDWEMPHLCRDRSTPKSTKYMVRR